MLPEMHSNVGVQGGYFEETLYVNFGFRFFLWHQSGLTHLISSLFTKGFNLQYWKVRFYIPSEKRAHCKLALYTSKIIPIVRFQTSVWTIWTRNRYSINFIKRNRVLEDHLDDIWDKTFLTNKILRVSKKTFGNLRSNREWTEKALFFRLRIHIIEIF